ncbi:transcription factor [Sarracenia purpurea var. burkii]
MSMEGGDSLVRISSARLSNATIWRHSGRDAFSESSREGNNDEEALKWAVLQKLPTYHRIRKGVLAGEDDEPIEIDINKLGPVERKNLLERLVRVAEEDNEKFLLKLKERIDR